MEGAGSKSAGDWSDSVDIESERVKGGRAGVAIIGARSAR